MKAFRADSLSLIGLLFLFIIAQVPTCVLSGQFFSLTRRTIGPGNPGRSILRQPGEPRRGPKKRVRFSDPLPSLHRELSERPSRRLSLRLPGPRGQQTPALERKFPTARHQGHDGGPERPRARPRLRLGGVSDYPGDK
ncbi:uncharacterized protein LOC119165877 isoform X2 [Rhipicephalus microplus]|uniref:uncharacterized protein LOC119165877 isoform X2 n=1 Tax=Rhipicephalus microplus TaxID=6941 RepID=UPI003F6BEB0E